jgi:hypothetical protein
MLVSMFRPIPQWKLGLIVLVGCGLAVVAVAGASATTVVKTSNSIPVDHQLCYAAKGVFKVPANVKLYNDLYPSGFTPTFISRQSELHCNPVTKTIPTPSGPQVYKVTHPADHLACLELAYGGWTAQNVQVQNQFGTAVLQTKQAGLFCLPSWKSLTGPPKKTVTAPPGLSHFACYFVTVQSGAYTPPARVLVRDEFTTRNEPIQVNPVPPFLCLPTAKKIGTKVYPKNNTEDLLCFYAPPTRHPAAVWDENQFGTAKMTFVAGSVEYLCLPSTSQILK